MASTHSSTKRRSATLFGRCALFVMGLALVVISREHLRQGVFSFTHMTYRQTVFSAAGIGTGILTMLLALLPSGDWVYRLITTKREVKLAHHTRRSKIHKLED